MKPTEAVITPFEMSIIYWRRMKSGSIHEIEFAMNKMAPIGKAYWNEVLMFLLIKKNGKKSLQ